MRARVPAEPTAEPHDCFVGNRRSIGRRVDVLVRLCVRQSVRLSTEGEGGGNFTAMSVCLGCLGPGALSLYLSLSLPSWGRVDDLLAGRTQVERPGGW